MQLKKARRLELKGLEAECIYYPAKKKITTKKSYRKNLVKNTRLKVKAYKFL